ncbi:MAG: TRAP transporter substrate-binding protein DctP [Alphaproteobacteria bacterium]
MKEQRHLRTILRGGAFAFIGAALMTEPALAQGAKVDGPEVKWTFSAYGTKRPGTSVFDHLVGMVDEQTGGKFKINLVYGEALASVRETLDSVKIGAFEIGHVVGSFHPGKLPTANIFDLPFLPVGNLTVQYKVALNYYKLPEVTADAARWNVYLLTPTLLPPYELAGKGKPPLSIADLKGMRIRAPGGMGAALKAVGVTPNNIPSPELYGALERGMFDALAFPFYAHGAYKTQDLVEWYTTNFELGILATFAVVNLDKWNALPPQYRDLVVSLVPKALERHVPDVKEGDEKILAILKARNVRAVTWPEAEHKKFIDMVAQPVWDAWVADMTKQGYPGQKLLDFVLSEAKKSAS